MTIDETPDDEEILVDELEGEPSVVVPDPAFEDTENPELIAHEMAPAVPNDLLELHLALEEAGVEAPTFKEAFHYNATSD